MTWTKMNIAMLPGDYPTPVSSYILTNNSTPGNISFIDDSQVMAPMLDQIGMVTDALWSDYDNLYSIIQMVSLKTLLLPQD